MARLDTDRLILRDRRSSEADVYRLLWSERDPRVPAHRRIDAQGRPSVADIASRVLAERENPGLGLLAVEVRATSAVIGYCGLVPHEGGSPDDVELAFELLQAVHGCGYATEAGQAVIGWAREAGHQRVWATVWEWNLASRRVLEKLGFHDSGGAVTSSVHGRSLLTVREL